MHNACVTGIVFDSLKMCLRTTREFPHDVYLNFTNG